MAADSLLARFIQRSRELGIALYLDDPSTCRMPPSGRIAAWQGAGEWLAIFAGRSMSRACGRNVGLDGSRLTGRPADDDGGGG